MESIRASPKLSAASSTQYHVLPCFRRKLMMTKQGHNFHRERGEISCTGPLDYEVLVPLLVGALQHTTVVECALVSFKKAGNTHGVIFTYTMEPQTILVVISLI